MNLLISGSRKVAVNEKTYQLLSNHIEHLTAEIGAATGAVEYPSLIIHGGARGVDELAAKLCKRRNINEMQVLPEYTHAHDKRAPLLRNDKMIEKAEYVIAIYHANDWQTGGTGYTAKRAIRKGLGVMEINEVGKYRYTPPRLSFF